MILKSQFNIQFVLHNDSFFLVVSAIHLKFYSLLLITEKVFENQKAINSIFSEKFYYTCESKCFEMDVPFSF